MTHDLQIYRPTMTGHIQHIGHPATLTVADAHTGAHRPNILAENRAAAEEVYRLHLAGTTNRTGVDVFNGRVVAIC